MAAKALIQIPAFRDFSLSAFLRDFFLFQLFGISIFQLFSSNSLPALQIRAAPDDLFSDQRGIYTHPLERGSNWERPVSVQFLTSNGVDQFQLKCGLRIHGGMTRRPDESPKHSFRLIFHHAYGPDTLHFPLFGPDAPTEFTSLILRSGGADSWLDSNGYLRARALYLRDEWMRKTFRAMGYPALRGIFVHLYLNGSYWGIYNLCENPAVPPKPSEPCDIIKAGKLQAGNRTAWDSLLSLAESDLSDPTNYHRIQAQLDLTEFADYMILNFFAGNSDWGRDSNWYALRPRVPGGRFRFFIWDAERTLGDLDADTTSFDDDQSPPHLFQQLAHSPAFRTLFADRVHQLFSSHGPLALSNAKARFLALVQQLEPALPAEATRWGDYRIKIHQYKTGPYESYNVTGSWQPEVKRILDHYLPERERILLDQLRQRGLVPEMEGAIDPVGRLRK